VWAIFTSRDPGPTATPNTNYNLGNNLFGSVGAFGAHPDLDSQIFDGKCAGTITYFNTTTQTAMTTADSSLGGCQWHVTTVWGAHSAAPSTNYSPDTTANGAVGVLYTFPIKGSIGSQINNILWQVPIGTTLFASGAANSVNLGKNAPLSDVPSEAQAPVAAAGLLSVVPATGVAAATATSGFNKPFGLGASVATTNALQIVAAATTASVVGTDARFPVIGGSERGEGVIHMGGDPTNVTDAKVYLPTVTANAIGPRAYYRALNAVIAD
jgi:hypothetical protein